MVANQSKPNVFPCSHGTPVVFVVIPVFNRMQFTKDCLNCLFDQTYSPLRLVVVDGGSTDGTQQYLRRHYPQVVLLRSEKELWWGGAMQKGIEYCLDQSCGAEDMLLMMNNDTQIGPTYIETLVRVSRERNAAVGGVIVDSRDSSRVLDGGEFVDWKSYSFSVRTVVDSGEAFLEGVDLLSGRGTLVPLLMVRQAGNVNADRYPHYIGDCEFFSRLKRHGFRLGVTYEAVIRSHVGETGMFTHGLAALTFRQAWEALFSIRSMDNVRDHWRFIEDCAPAPLRRGVKRQLIRRSVYLVLCRTKLKHVGLPLSWFLAGSYYVTKRDCIECGCDPDELTADGILRPWIRSDWYVFASVPRERTKESKELKRLYRRAWNPGTKPARWMKVKIYSLRAPKGTGGSPSIGKHAEAAPSAQKILQ